MHEEPGVSWDPAIKVDLCETRSGLAEAQGWTGLELELELELWQSVELLEGSWGVRHSREPGPGWSR